MIIMDKTAYFESLLRRDFLRFVFLREPFLTGDVVVDRLMEAVGVGDVIQQLKRDIREVILRHTERSHQHELDTVAAGHLAPWLLPEIVDDIMADYGAAIDAALPLSAYIGRLMAQIERMTWIQGPGDMVVCLGLFVDKLARLAAGFGDIPVSGPSRDELLAGYELARRITVAERITGSNTRDVARYTDMLDAYARARCEEILYGKIVDMYRRIIDTPALIQVIDRYRAMSLMTPLPEPERHSEWDAEYNRLIPVDFYERNIDNIDGAMAFQMVLLHAFARHEDELRAAGFLGEDGQLRIFTAENFSPEKWIEMNIRYILD